MDQPQHFEELLGDSCGQGCVKQITQTQAASGQAGQTPRLLEQEASPGPELWSHLLLHGPHTGLKLPLFPEHGIPPRLPARGPSP